MRLLLLAAAACLGILASGPVRADISGGLRAYDAGDYGAAFRAWRPLAERGDADAQVALAGMYMAGQGVRRNAAAAAEWYGRAARQGHLIAQLNLGDLYARGIGVKRDPVRAYLWLDLAARQGNGWAADRRRQVARRMTPRQIAAARKRSRAWRARR